MCPGPRPWRPLRFLRAGKRRYDRKQSGYGGQTKPVFHKKVRARGERARRWNCKGERERARRWGLGAGAPWRLLQCEGAWGREAAPREEVWAWDSVGRLLIRVFSARTCLFRRAGQDHQEDRAASPVPGLPRPAHARHQGTRQAGGGRSLFRWTERSPLGCSPWFGAALPEAFLEQLGGSAESSAAGRGAGAFEGRADASQALGERSLPAGKRLPPLSRRGLVVLTPRLFSRFSAQRCKHFEIGGEKKNKNSLY